jgi:hypothetical protein
VYPANKGGHFENDADMPVFGPLLHKLGMKATERFVECRPELYAALQKQGYKGVYGMFHLCMLKKGASKYHRDLNDFIAFLFMIN